MGLSPVICERPLSKLPAFRTPITLHGKSNLRANSEFRSAFFTDRRMSTQSRHIFKAFYMNDIEAVEAAVAVLKNPDGDAAPIAEHSF